MRAEESLKLMSEIQKEYRNIYYGNPDLGKNGFFLCGLFGNMLRQHDILILGTNPGGYDKFTDINKLHKEEIASYVKNQSYNELIEGKEPFFNKTKELYEIAFDHNYHIKLKDTFYWNICLLRNHKKYSDLENNVKLLGYDSFYSLFLELLTIVKPKVIMTFIDVFNYLQTKIGFKSDCSNLNIEKSITYYYYSSNIQLNGDTISKIIGIPHFTGYRWKPEIWKVFAQKFGRDFEEIKTTKI